MESIAGVARKCFNKFAELTSVLANTSAENREAMPPDKLEWEHSRFKIWCGNLGALQAGSSSLDSRLRDSTVMRTNIFEHLVRLNRTLVDSWDVVSGARPPLEEQQPPEDLSSESSSSDNDDSEYSSSDNGDSDEELPKELALHVSSIKDIMNDLYMLSFRIRNNSTRPTSDLRIKVYSEVDEETGVDKFAAYKEFDKRYVEDLLLQLRRDVADEVEADLAEFVQIRKSDQYLVDRLVATIDKRRKALRYWKRHARKIAEIPKDPEVKVVITPQLLPQVKPAATVIRRPDKSVALEPTVIEKTIFSQTEATKFDKSLDNMLEVQSVISYASTRAEGGSEDIALPPPPRAAFTGTEFLCPYCGIVCPARHGRGRAWRAHILRDLQPYICTYDKCEDGDRLFGSQTAWLEHERLRHRRVWQCFEHIDPKFGSKSALQDHLRSEHGNNVTDEQVQSLGELSELSIEDTRATCLFCRSEGPFLKGLASHMALHMRRLATFPVSRDISAPGDEDEDNVDTSDNQSVHKGSLRSRVPLSSGPLQFGSQSALSRASDSGIHLPNEEPNYDDYNILWLTTRRVVYSACKRMRDETFARRESLEDEFSLGRICEYNVVIACIEVQRTRITVSGILKMFPNLKLFLSIGVGGAAYNSNVRLGDVVIGTPLGKYPGIIFLKGRRSGRELWTDYREYPSGLKSIISAIGHLKAIYELDECAFIRKLERWLENVKVPDQSSDQRFKPMYMHIDMGWDDCDYCDPSMEIGREHREPKGPRVYYGPIGSSRTAIDIWADQDTKQELHRALCFETEAIELCNASIPFVAIRGICDYSDSHKYEAWKPYAAISAAVYAKELLQVLFIEDVFSMSNLVDQIGFDGTNVELSLNVQQEMDKFAFLAQPELSEINEHGQETSSVLENKVSGYREIAEEETRGVLKDIKVETDQEREEKDTLRDLYGREAASVILPQRPIESEAEGGLLEATQNKDIQTDTLPDTELKVDPEDGPRVGPYLEELKEVLQDACRYNSTRYRDARTSACEGSCTWIFEDPKFDSWVSAKASDIVEPTLWITGDIGVGKTVMCGVAIDYVENLYPGSTAFIFTDYEYSPEEVLQCLAYQLLVQGTRISPDDLLSSHDFLIDAKLYRDADQDTLQALLHDLLRKRDLTFIFLDYSYSKAPPPEWGSSETSNIHPNLNRLLEFLITSTYTSETKIRLWGSSRKLWPGTSTTLGCPLEIELCHENIADDIWKFVTMKLFETLERLNLEYTEELADFVQSIELTKYNLDFRFADFLVCDRFKSCQNLEEVLEILFRMPTAHLLGGPRKEILEKPGWIYEKLRQYDARVFCRPYRGPPIKPPMTFK